MSCILNISLSKKHVDYFRSLLNKPREMGHVMYYDLPKYTKPNQATFLFSKHLDKPSNGDSTGVITPIGAINMHTHPQVAYNHEGCKLGWPSGEDFRESLRYSMKNMVAHFVITLEGIYLIKANPCLVRFLKGLKSDLDRGIVHTAIELYFANFHVFRIPEAMNYVKRHKKTKITPQWFLRKSNNFRLDKIKNVPAFDKTYFEEDLEDLLQNEANFGKLDIILINKKGNMGSIKRITIPEFIKRYNKIVKKFKNINCKTKRSNCRKIDKQWNDQPFQVCFFPYNKKRLPSFKVYYPSVNNKCYPKKVLFDSPIVIKK